MKKKEVKGMAVTVRGDNINGALRQLKKKLQEDGVIKELRDRKHYVKPSEKKRKDKAAAKRRWQKRLKEIDPFQ